MKDKFRKLDNLALGSRDNGRTTHKFLLHDLFVADHREGRPVKFYGSGGTDVTLVEDYLAHKLVEGDLLVRPQDWSKYYSNLQKS